MKKKTRKQGFTLVEVLVVMAIVALLAATAIPKVKGIYQDAQLDKAEADAMQIVAAIQRVELKNELSNKTPVVVFEEDKTLTPEDFVLLNLGTIKSNFTFKFVLSSETAPNTGHRVIQVIDHADSENHKIEREVMIPE